VPFLNGSPAVGLARGHSATGNYEEIALQGRFDFSEGGSAKWIFDVEIEKMCAYFFYFEKTKIMLGEQEKLLIERLRPAFYTFIINFLEMAFHDLFAITTPKHLHLG
jgi:hypothetical protein